MKNTLKKGRPTKLSSHLVRDAILLIQSGNTYECACNSVGITYRTFRNWMKLGEEGHEEFFHFFHAIKKAEAEAAIDAMHCIREAAKKDWRAAAWWLERRRPEEYSLRNSRFHMPEGAQVPQIDYLAEAKARLTPREKTLLGVS